MGDVAELTKQNPTANAKTRPRTALGYRLRMLLRPRGREAFVQGLPPGAILLDVGCGDNSPQRTVSQRPDLYYVGIDVGDYKQLFDPQNFAKEYILCDPDDFAKQIIALGQRFDAVISSHNIEHCNDPDAVLHAMSAGLKPGGRLFLAWPGEHTVRLPSRRGTLNFYDDPTHKHLPGFLAVVQALSKAGLTPEFGTRAYRPLIPFFAGILFEPICMLRKTLAPLRATWALYGFESIVWFKKV